MAIKKRFRMPKFVVCIKAMSELHLPELGLLARTVMSITALQRGKFVMYHTVFIIVCAT